MSKGAIIINDPKKRRKCPVCSQNIHLYYMNFEEMFLMCENRLCEFPFGYEPIQIVRNESQLQENPGIASKNFFEYPVIDANGAPAISMPLSCTTDTSIGTISSLSCGFLSDCDQLSIVSETDDMALDKDEQFIARQIRERSQRKKRQQTDKEIESNLKNIKELTEEMRHLLDDDRKYNCKVIKNKKWLKNLKTWEGQTGTKLLSDDENKVLAKSAPELSVGELNISFDRTAVESSSPAINIQILVNAPYTTDC